MLAGIGKAIQPPSRIYYTQTVTTETVMEDASFYVLFESRTRRAVPKIAGNRARNIQR